MEATWGLVGCGVEAVWRRLGGGEGTAREVRRDGVWGALLLRAGSGGVEAVGPVLAQESAFDFRQPVLLQQRSQNSKPVLGVRGTSDRQGRFAAIQQQGILVSTTFAQRFLYSGGFYTANCVQSTYRSCK